MREAGELGSKNHDRGRVKIPPCQRTCWQAEAIPERTTHKCVLLSQGTKALYQQSKKTEWEDLMGRVAQSYRGWATSLWLG